MDYGVFRLTLVMRILSEKLTPKQAGEILATYAREHCCSPPTVEEIRMLMGLESWADAPPPRRIPKRYSDTVVQRWDQV